MEPINIIVIADKETLNNSFLNSGWYPLDRLSVKSIWKLANALLFKKPYPSTPSLPVFWSTYPNTINFGKPTESNSPHERHHVHFWPTPFKTIDDQDIWVGTAHFDQEIKGRFSPIHRTNPAVDKERDLIKNDLDKGSKIGYFEEFQITEATFGIKQTGNQFFTDGKAYILSLTDD
jgi:LssY-like putative type I secretion system component LssY